MTQLPVTPYNGTGGHVDQPASRDRAIHDVESGQLAERQQTLLDLLHRKGTYGATWRELSDELDQHHGTVSGALSNLHKGELVFMLREKRKGSHIYVHKNFRSYFQQVDRIDEPVKTKANQYRYVLSKVVDAINACEQNGWRTKDLHQLQRMRDIIVAGVLEDN